MIARLRIVLSAMLLTTILVAVFLVIGLSSWALVISVAGVIGVAYLGWEQ